MAIIGLRGESWMTTLHYMGRYSRSLLVSAASLSLIFQPILVHAGGLTVDPNVGANNRPNINAAPNGVPSIDIATPNGSGLSHNKYHEFNVDNPGLILNNLNGEVGTSQLGGVMPGNPNLRQSGSASVILNEVTSGNRSALNGPAEVFGRKADVIIANPNGVTCNGCGFINTPRATLTTGIPQIGLDGSLTGFDVRGGDVTIGEKGANLASGKGSVDIFDIVSRSVHLDGAVAGHDVGITAGTGKFDYASREMKELYDIAGKPEYAIDGSALGALQGDRIKVIATEKGVGVRMRNDMAANVGQLILSADGKISLNNASGREGVDVASRSKTVAAKKITSKKNVEIKANDGITLETIGADGDLMVDSGAGLLSIEGDAIVSGKLGFKSGDLIKANQVASGGAMDLVAANGIDVLAAIADGQARLHAESGDINAKNGVKAGGGDLVIWADKGSINAGTLISFNNMTLQAGQDLNVIGNVIAQANINAAIGHNVAALNFIAGMDMAATDKSGNLTLGKQGGLTVKTGSGSIKSGNIYANNDIELDTGQDVAISSTILSSQGGVAIKAERGQSNAVSFDRLMADGVSTIRSKSLTFNSLLSGSDVTLDIDRLDAGLVLSGMDMDASQNSSTGDIFLKDHGKLMINAADAINAKQLLSAGDMVLHAVNDLNYGNLASYGNANITSDKGVISIQNATAAAGNITLTALSLDLSNNRAKIQTARTLTLNANDINVLNSKLIYGGLNLNGKNKLNARNASLNAITKNGGSGDITLNLPSLVADEYTDIRAENDLSINIADIDNNGVIASGNDLKFYVSNTLTNHQSGLIFAGRDGYIYVDGTVTIDYGAIMSGNNLTFANRAGNGRTTTIVNKAGLIQSGNNLAILTSYLKNEADKAPTWSKYQEYGERIKFARPDKNNELYNYGVSDMRGLLLYQPEHEDELPWGAGGCSNGCDKTWLQVPLWKTKEQTYGDLQVDGKIYKAFTWNEIDRNSGKGKIWYGFNTNAFMQQQNDVQFFTDKPTIQGMIQSKGDMSIDATTIDNSYSNIEAARKASIIADTVNNIGMTLYRTKYMYCGAGDTCFVYDANGNKTGEYINNGEVGYLGSEVVDSVNSTIKAGDLLTMNVGTLNNLAAEGSITGSAHFEAKPVSGNPLDALKGLTAGGALFKSNANISAPNFNPGMQLPAPKPNSGGFGGTLPNQSFIYETRADFLDVGKFYGSGYYLDRVGYKPDKQIVFLGDAYFENQLIDKQMRDLVGQGLGKGSFVPGNDVIDQMKALLDAGADYSVKNGLVFGEPLTPEQVANLDQSVVVYVKQNINGVDVYAPVLYVSAKDRSSVVSSGAKIEGGSVNITADNLTHSGLIASNTSLKLEGKEILSKGGGFAAKGDLLLASTGNIQLDAVTSTRNGQTVINRTQAIDAGGTAIIQAEKNVDLNGVDAKAGGSLGIYGENVNVGAAKTTNNGSESVQGSNVEAGMDLQVKANQDINIEGSRVRADGQLAMLADKGNLTIQSSNGTIQSGTDKTTVQQSSQVSSGSSMSLSADKNITIAGSNVDSSGSLGIKAGENVAIVATQETSATKDGTVAYDTTKNVSSSVSAKNDMGIEAGQNILIGASDLKAGGNIGVQAQGDISVVAMADSHNSSVNGEIAQGESHSTTAVGSSITSGGNVTAIAGLDGKDHNLNIIGSSVDADGKVGLKTTGDINILASQDTQQSRFHMEEDGGTFGGGKHTSDKSRDAVIYNGSFISGDKGVNIQSGQNTTIAGSAIVAGTEDNKADINIKAGNNIIISSETSSLAMSDSKSDKGFLSSGSKKTTSYDEYAISSNLGASGNINLGAGEHIAIAGSNIHAVNDVNMEGSSVSIIGAQEDHNASATKKKSGFGVGSGDGFYSIWGKEGKTQTSETTVNVSSNISAGNNVNITARDSDVNIVGSNVIAQNDINLDAARDINVLPGKESYAQSETKTKSGIGVQLSHSDTGASIGLGYNSTKDSKSSDAAINAKSGLRAGNDVNMKAGNDVNIQAADVSAMRDVNIHATNDVNLLAANDVTNYKEMHEKLFAGITMSVESGTLQGIQSINKAVEDFKNAGTDKNGLLNIAAGIYNGQTGNGRISGTFEDINALAHGTGLNDKSIGKTGKKDGPSILDKGNLISGSLTVGFQKSKTEMNQSTSSPVVTTIEGGRSVNINADNGDINGVGVQIGAGRNTIWNLLGDDKAGDINLTAGKDINLISALGTQSTSGKSSSYGGGIGIELNGTPTANANFTHGNLKSDGIFNVNSHVVGTGDISLKSGNDTNLKGAVVMGESVKADIGGDLNIESMQDTASSHSKLDTISVNNGSAGIGGEWQYKKSQSDYASVVEQSGIVAGNGGFDLKVKKNTGLKGGAITSTADANKNRLETGSLTTSDIENHASAKAETGGIMLPAGALDQGKYGIAKTIIGSLMNKGEASESNFGQTKSVISSGTIVITDEDKQRALTGHGANDTIAMLNRDVANANTPAEKIDSEKLAKKAAEEQALMQDLFKLGVQYTDDAYKTLFKTEQPMDGVLTDAEGRVLRDKSGNPIYYRLTPEQQASLQAGKNNKVRVYFNGINTPEDRAVSYGIELINDPTAGPIYIKWFPPADTKIGELLVAGYQKVLENNFWGMTDSALTARQLQQQFGSDGLILYGHSRGSMTILNAMRSLGKNQNELLANTELKFYGPAANAKQAAELLNKLSGGKSNSVYVENHKVDFVGSFVGGNPTTMTQIPGGSNNTMEILNVLLGRFSAHGCYGNSSGECRNSFGSSHGVYVRAGR
ncbi:hemagglutinin repeat-containing protein [Bartonella sp. W8097]|nr:hemagglutinin repeat-containing protein [Bartonella apihabitans]MBI0021422.1 hemagglutinin repeat-containing protein [Bartonella apihabitans]